MATPSLAIRINQEYTSLVPKMSDSEYESFKQDIKENGLRIPITVNPDGIILDGHHRYRACRELGIQCESEPPKSFDDQLEEKDYVIGVNLERRNVSDYQKGIMILKRKAIRSEIARRNMLKGKTLDSFESRVDTNKELAKSVGLSKSKLRKIEIIQREAPPKYIEKVTKGVWSIDATYQKIDNDRKIQKLIDAAPAIDLPDRISLHQGNFMKIDHKTIPDNSIDHIITDPPYAERSISVYKDLGVFAARVIRKGGSLAVITGHEVMFDCAGYIKEAGLKYIHLFPIIHSGGHALLFYPKISVFYKPLLLFVKGDTPDLHHPFNDVIYSSPSKKDVHHYQQSPVEAEHMIEGLTVGENQIVCDPFMGSGTFGTAAIKLNRIFIGIEIDPIEFQKAEANIKDYYSKVKSDLSQGVSIS